MKSPFICAKEGSDGVLVAHEKCNNYYICDHGTPVAQTCPANLYFNPKNDECDWPKNVNCKGRIIPGPIKDENVGAGNSDPSKAPYICAAKNSSGVLVAHEICNNYYICVNGKPLAQRCPASLVFNPEKDECDWPKNVCCKDRVILGPREDTQNDWDLSVNDDNSKIRNVGAGNSDPSKAPYICAAKNSSGVLVAHEKCNRYYICDHGKPVARRCPARLLFNPKKDQCDWPRNVNCRRRVILGPREDTQKDWDLSVNGDDSKNGNVGAGNSDSSKAPYICAAKNSSGVLIAHEKCHKYYICDNGKPVVRHCPANLFFNPKKDQCDWPENVDCRDKDTSGSSESNSEEDSSEEDSSEEDSSEEDSSEEDSTENEIIRERFLKRLLRALREIIRRLLRN
ncbi:hypothetical protein ABMA27_005623 [Loxostege sticticalis]|uniref:Chitin-binding type-2 domain-containing protein n=1 Tax=Loxostege sticticalis TaxID=481309 RepID=A0ABR3HJU7_LOXSC